MPWKTRVLEQRCRGSEYSRRSSLSLRNEVSKTFSSAFSPGVDVVGVVIDDVGRDGGVLRVGAVLVEVHARDDHAGVTPFERVLQLALIGQREVGHRIGLAAPLGAERQPQPETLVRQRVAHAGRPVGVDAPQVEQFVFGRGEPALPVSASTTIWFEQST